MHEVQLVLSPKHVPQVALHARHWPRPCEAERKNAEGHTDVQVPAGGDGPALKLAPWKQDVHELAPASVQAAHEASQSVHVPLASANLPDGQLARQLPSSR